MKNIMLALVTSLVLACSSATRLPEPPAWITNPGDGVVGSSVTHVKGRHFQQELAIARARERLAARYGVEVSSVQTITQNVVNDRAYVISNKTIDQAVKQRTVKAQIRETWLDTAHDEFWVWMYPVE